MSDVSDKAGTALAPRPKVTVVCESSIAGGGMPAGEAAASMAAPTMASLGWTWFM